MLVDFSLSAEDWLGYIKQFLEMVIDFFKYLGINLFNDSENTTEETETNGQ